MATAMKLFVDGIEKGNVIHYEQDRNNKRWTFMMDGGETVSVRFSDIRLFTSSGELNILTYHDGRREEKRDKVDVLKGAGV